jgi:hypothetical protein
MYAEDTPTAILLCHLFRELGLIEILCREPERDPSLAPPGCNASYQVLMAHITLVSKTGHSAGSLV